MSANIQITHESRVEEIRKELVALYDRGARYWWSYASEMETLETKNKENKNKDSNPLRYYQHAHYCEQTAQTLNQIILDINKRQPIQHGKLIRNIRLHTSIPVGLKNDSGEKKLGQLNQELDSLLLHLQ